MDKLLKSDKNTSLNTLMRMKLLGVHFLLQICYVQVKKKPHIAVSSIFLNSYNLLNAAIERKVRSSSPDILFDFS